MLSNQSGAGSCRKRSGGRAGRFFSAIALSGVQLSDDQVERLAELRGDLWLKFAQLKADVMPRVRESMRLLSQPTIDKARVKAIHKEIQQKRNEIGDFFVENVLSGCEVLTAEQRKQVRTAMLRHLMGLEDEPEAHN